jgi:hypothetical protein
MYWYICVFDNTIALEEKTNLKIAGRILAEEKSLYVFVL